MLQGRSVIVVVPAFEEEAHIARVIETMPGFVDRIVVVDDGSGDRTSERADAASASLDPVGSNGRETRTIIVRHPRRLGVGAAIATGYRAALNLGLCSDDLLTTTRPGAHDAVAVMAGDGQMHPDDLAGVVLPIIRGSADYVKGERFGHRSVRSKMGWPRWVGGQVFSRLTSLAIGQHITDSQCGFTAVSQRALGLLDLDDLWPSFGYPNDVLGQLAARRARIHEVPVQPVYGSEISKLRLRHLPPIFFLIGRAAVRRTDRSVPSMTENVAQTVDTPPKDLRTDAAASS